MILHARVVAGSGGGPDKTILASAPHMARTRSRMAALYIHPRHDDGIHVIRERAGLTGCELHTIPEDGPLDPRTVTQAIELCRTLGVAVWHGHDYKTNLLGLILRRFWPMRLVTTIHGWTWDTLRTRVYYRVDNWCLKRYERVMAVSPLHLTHCKRLGIPDEKVVYIPNGVDTEVFRPEGRLMDGGTSRGGAEVESEGEARWVDGSIPRLDGVGIARDAGRFVLGVVARLSPEKGVDRAIRCLSAITGRGRDVELRIVGDGPERERLEALASSLGVAERVRWGGWEKDMAAAYRGMDALLLPSLTEGMPNAVLEAMACGVPVAATDVGGVRELLDEGRCGVVLDARDDTAWPTVIEPLLVSPGRRIELARRARERVVENYSFDRRMAKEIAVYEDVLGVTLRDVPAVRRAA